MKNIIILNLTRMGDLIQSTALFHKIKILYPDSFVRLVMLKDFESISPFLPYIDEVKCIDLNILNNILKLNNFTFTLEVLTYVNEIFKGITDVRYDLAINLSHDEFSVYFLYLLSAKKHIGISITREGTIVSNDEMISYMFSAVKNRKVSVLNLVDIYQWALQDKQDKKAEAAGDSNNLNPNKIYLDIKENVKEESNKYLRYLNKIGISEEDEVFSFAIGASTELKKWRYDYFAELAKLLLDSEPKIKVVLLGADYDVEAASFIESTVSNGRLINMAGKTSILELIYIVKRSDILITHDTGTMHIGVALGVKSIVIYTGNVGYLETGPYAENRLLFVPDIECFPCDFNLKCMNPVCKNLIKPQYLYDMSILMLKNGKNKNNGGNEDYAGLLKTELLRNKDKYSGMTGIISRFDSLNFIDFMPVFKRRLKFKDLNLKVLKTALESFYNFNYNYRNRNNRGAEDCLKAAKDEAAIFLDSFKSIEYNLIADIEEELKCADKLIEFCREGMKAAKDLAYLGLNNPFELSKIDEKVDLIKSVDFELKYISSSYDEFSLMNQIHVINQNSSVSYDIFGLGVDSLKSYSKFKLQLKIFKDITVMFLEEINKKFI